MKKLLYVLFVIFVLFYSCLSYAQSVAKPGTLTVCSEIGYVPFEFKASNGEFIGFDMDLAAGFAKSLGLQINVVNTPWDSMIPNVQNNQCDMLISGMTITTARKQKVDYSNPYYAGGQILIVNKSKQGIIKSFRDANTPSVKITVVNKDMNSTKIVLTFFTKATIDKSTTQILDAATLVANGQADVFIFDRPYLESLYLDPKFSSTTYLVLPQFTYEPFGAGFNKNNTDLLKAFNKYLDQIKANGEFDKMYNYWFNATDWRKRI